MAKRVALYLRVSTGEQTTTNQRRELEAWAARCGYTVTEVYEDHAVSGAKSNDQRPALTRLLKDAVRRRVRHRSGVGGRPHGAQSDGSAEHVADPEAE